MITREMEFEGSGDAIVELITHMVKNVVLRGEKAFLRNAFLHPTFSDIGTGRVSFTVAVDKPDPKEDMWMEIYYSHHEGATDGYGSLTVKKIWYHEKPFPTPEESEKKFQWGYSWLDLDTIFTRLFGVSPSGERKRHVFA
ncbi:MAG: hypothetical protein DRO04_03085 [Candidatus Iainarchaeum archaeon]|uniref:Uncharacterized protein n=1 Tax=Candidatus Iainarchaeum sp. TaxID=3101447 RepID=A0A497JIS1_9ARCH|nr:MAG: hypothetical protein DRO04_03085 [Candidatus Diapherotrites archaeon]